ncbi:MAG: hypothetical protein AAFQ82_19675, partial [Myxococcota bacterium]
MSPETRGGFAVSDVVADNVLLSSPGLGGTGELRIARLDARANPRPAIVTDDGGFSLDINGARLSDVHGSFAFAGDASRVQLGEGDDEGEGINVENVRLAYDSTSEVLEIAGEPIDFVSRVGALELIDGDVADVELDIALGEGTIDIPGRSRFEYRSGENGGMALESLEPEGRFTFRGQIAEFELGRSAAEVEEQPENQLSGVLNQVSLALSDETSGEISGRSIRFNTGELPVMDDIEIDLDITVDELGFPAGFEQPVRFFGGTGGQLQLSLDRQEGDAFMRGEGSFDATFGGEARARSQRIQGLEDALVNVRADGGDAQVRGQLLFTPDGTINVDVTGTGQPTIDIEMERGEVQNVGELNETERRFTPLPDHELIEIDAPRELPLGGQQTPFQVDVGNAVSALLDGGQLSLNIPMEQSESGRFTLNMVETEDDGDRVGTRIHVDRLASGAGNANFNLVFDGEGEDSRLNAERSGITFTEPVELNLAFQHYFNGPVQLPIPEGNVYTTQGRIRGVSFEETGNGNVRVVPDIEIDSFRTSPFLDVGPLLNTDWVRSQVGEQLGSALVSQPLFGRDTLPQERDALIGALREGAFAHALGPQAAQSEG